MMRIRRAAALIAVTAVLAAAGCGEPETYYLSAESTEAVSGEAVTAEETSGEENISPESAEADAHETICVHVCGAVNSPGVVELQEGSRVVDAVEAAGGFAADAAEDYLNLAETVSDGMKITVPTVAECSSLAAESAAESIAAASSEAERESGLVNLNTATRDELMTLPGIGEAKADAILSYREAHGTFETTEEIMQVSGIKSGAYEKIKDLITVQ